MSRAALTRTNLLLEPEKSGSFARLSGHEAIQKPCGWSSTNAWRWKPACKPCAVCESAVVWTTSSAAPRQRPLHPSPDFCHSERSEESLFGLDNRTERFFASPRRDASVRALRMTRAGVAVRPPKLWNPHAETGRVRGNPAPRRGAARRSWDSRCRGSRSGWRAGLLQNST